MLPTQKTEKKNELRDFTTLIYGQPKIGKSTWASHADGALFLATEAGLNNLEVFQMPITTWSDFLSACSDIAKTDHNFKTIVIDTIDNLYKLCVDSVLTKNNLKHESDLEYGKGYAFVSNEFQKRLTALSLLPYGLIMISHSVGKEVKTRTGKELRIAPTLPNSACKIVIGMTDLILYAEMNEIKDNDGNITGFDRVIRTKPTTIYEAGDRTGKLPETMPLDYGLFEMAMKNHNANQIKPIEVEFKVEEPKGVIAHDTEAPKSTLEQIKEKTALRNPNSQTTTRVHSNQTRNSNQIKTGGTK